MMSLIGLIIVGSLPGVVALSLGYDITTWQYWVFAVPVAYAIGALWPPPVFRR